MLSSKSKVLIEVASYKIAEQNLSITEEISTPKFESREKEKHRNMNITKIGIKRG